MRALRRRCCAGAVIPRSMRSYFAPLCDGAGTAGAGAAGRGEVAPDPVVLFGALLVAGADEPLLAVSELLFHPAMIRKAINTRTATPAIQPHIPPLPVSRRNTGSLR